jgi:hypothetical protein
VFIHHNLVTLFWVSVVSGFQTDMVYELLRTSTDAPLASTPVWARDFASPEELITEFSRECRIVRKGLISTSYFVSYNFKTR